MPALSNGVLSHNQFSFTSFNASNGFPIQFQLNINVLSSSLTIKLNQVEGLIYNSSIYSQVKFTSSQNTNGENLVISLNFFKFYLKIYNNFRNSNTIPIVKIQLLEY